MGAMTIGPNFNPAHPFYQSAIRFPQRLAMSAEQTDLTYFESGVLVRNLAAMLRRTSGLPARRVGILASRSIEACIGVLGACWAGAIYVPLSLRQAEDRLLSVLELAEIDALVADARGAELLSEQVLSACPNLVFVPDQDIARRLKPRKEQNIHRLDALDKSPNDHQPAFVGAEDIAYIMFTSGTTGTPKGVMVSAGALHQYISVTQEQYRILPEDRVAETIDLSFDLSVSNMFTTWNAGASLQIVSTTNSISPAKVIRDKGATVWLTTPSSIAVMKRLKALRPGMLPDLRLTLFCGEPLPLSSVISWREAAPNSRIDNLYGPTEATVACLWQRVAEKPLVTPEREIVAIGAPYPGMEAAIVDDKLEFLPPRMHGELALSGPQLSKGYLAKPDLTVARFPTIGGKRWYLTGDVAYQDESGIFHHLGRIDHQVKVRGFRVELEDVESHMRSVCGTELVAAVAWPIAHGSAEGIVGFIAGKEIDPAIVLEGLRTRLTSYMLPTAIHSLAEMPLSANGKIDRKALLTRLDEEGS